MPGANIIAQVSSPVSEQRDGHFHSDFMFSVVALVILHIHRRSNVWHISIKTPSRIKELDRTDETLHGEQK